MTSNTTSSSRVKNTERQLSDVGWRAGVARDKLIFVMVCSVSIAVALVSILVVTLSGPQAGSATTWQCLECECEFTTRTLQMPPLPCPKCAGQAVKVHYRTCPGCKKPVIFHRQRQSNNDLGQMDFSPGRPAGVAPMEFQYWHEQRDGTYAWSDWMHPLSAAALKIKADMECPDCQAKLNPTAR